MGRDEPFKSDVRRLAFLMGLCAVIGGYLILTTAVISKDGVFYIEQARQIAQDPVGVCRRYPPGYPFLLWASHRIAGVFVQDDSPTLWVRSAQAVTLLCRVLALIPLYFLGKRLVGAADSFWAVLALVVLPYPAFYGSDVLREWPYVLFLSTGLLLLHWALSTRRGWVLALVGLDAGLGYLIRPECAQLVVYAVLGLLVVRRSGNAANLAPRATPDAPRLRAGLLALAGFVAPIVPYVCASGGIVPQQFRPPMVNMPPVISAVGPKAATDGPLEFEVRVGEQLELPIQASDPGGDRLTFSLAGVPIGSRPVYGFRLMASGSPFWTIVAQEKDRLATASRETWDFEGIDWYAYDRPDARPGLRPVYRFWSPVRQRHFFTMSESEKDALVAESPAPGREGRDASGRWIFEEAVFYAFNEKDRPADTLPVYRSGDEQGGYSWSMTPPTQADVREAPVAWYAHPAGAPAGAAIEDGVLRWRPSPGQEGAHQVNIVVTDGTACCCQLAIVRVMGVREKAAGGRQQAAGSCRVHTTHPLLFHSIEKRCVVRTLRRLLDAADEVVDGLLDDFLFVAALPWILGLCYRLRGRQAPLERALILAVLAVNVGLMFGRHLWVAPGSGRRYGLPLIALTIFYLPAGLDVMTRMLNRLYTFRRRRAAGGGAGRAPWFYLLMLGGVLLGAPKLILTPLRQEKFGYRAAGQWLRHHAPPDAVVAEPDGRISFYAQRAGIGYTRYPNWRKADFVVEITGGDAIQTPEGWTRVYTVPVDRSSKRTLVLYARDPAGRRTGK